MYRKRSLLFCNAMLTKNQRRLACEFCLLFQITMCDFNKNRVLEYEFSELCETDVAKALKQFHSLMPLEGKLVYKDGRDTKLFSLKGTIPVLIWGVKYNIPIQLWLDERHPYVPPLVFVTPTNTMKIKPSQFVNSEGKVYHPYLAEWQSESKSNLLDLLQILCKVFAALPPVYAIITEHQLQQTGNSQSFLLEENSSLPRRAPTTEDNIVSQKQLITEQQLREKNEELSHQLLRSQAQLQEKEEEKTNLLREKEQQERQLREMSQQLADVQGQLQHRDQEADNLRNRVTALKRQLRVKDQEVNELEISLSTTQLMLNENPRQQLPDWVISRDQIHVTDKCLGRGAWGSVFEGKYRGCAVAVKQIHEMILSPHNWRLFEREMNIASRCRHPCLLQFIGATNDEGNPLFVTELMESSLRAVLEQQSLSSVEGSVITLDVALGINYLHLNEPSPIIHRDISSANVLLWRQADRWRGKLSDYGTANVMQQTMTVGPGAMIYSAPEAHTKRQTVKVDVYSFGVLLCEICNRELPDPDRRDQQVAMVTDRALRGVIRRCIQQDPEARPSMEDLIGNWNN